MIFSQRFVVTLLVAFLCCFCLSCALDDPSTSSGQADGDADDDAQEIDDDADDDGDDDGGPDDDLDDDAGDDDTVLPDDDADDDADDDTALPDDDVNDDADDDTQDQCWDFDIQCGDYVFGTNIGFGADFDKYGCTPWIETGPDVVYRLELTEPSHIRAGIDFAMFDAHIFLLTDCANQDSCIAYSYNYYSVACLEPGVYYIVVDNEWYSPPGIFAIDLNCGPCEEEA